MHTELLKIFYQKIPFLEYLVRMIYLLIFPKIDKNEKLETGPLRFALWDVFLCISLFTTISMFMGITSGDNYTKILDIFSNQIVFYISFGYFAVWYIVIFYVAILLFSTIRTFVIERKIKNESNTALICALQFARTYSLVLFMFFPIILFVLNSILTQNSGIEKITENKLATSLMIAIFFVAIYLWCLVRPIKKYLNLEIKNRYAYPLVVFLTLFPMSFSHQIYTPDWLKLSINNDVLLKIFIQANATYHAKT